jgi:hypothetical protein
MKPDDEILRHLASQGGGLIEVYVRDTTAADWADAVARLVAEGYPVSLTWRGDSVPVRVTDEMFADEEETPWMLRVQVGAQDWTTVMYESSMIDFQGNPEPVARKDDLDEVRKFMSTLVRATGKTAILIPESLDIDTVTPFLEIGPDA